MASNKATTSQKDYAERVKTMVPEEYAKQSSWQRWMNTLVLDLFQMSFDNKGFEEQKILDVGCGTGNITRELLLPKCGHGARIVATDVSQDLLDYAGNHFAHPMIEYDVLNIGGDVSDFLKKHGLFTRVYSFFCLNWFKDQRPAIQNIAEAMAPRSECLLVFDARNPFVEFRKRLTEYDRWNKYAKVNPFLCSITIQREQF